MLVAVTISLKPSELMLALPIHGQYKLAAKLLSADQLTVDSISKISSDICSLLAGSSYDRRSILITPPPLMQIAACLKQVLVDQDLDLRDLPS